MLSPPGCLQAMLPSSLAAKANGGSLIPLLRDLYLTVGENTISLTELESFLSKTSSPHKIITWCILYLLGQLSSYPIDMNSGYGFYDDERNFVRLMWEIISKHTYLNYYKIVCETESCRVKNRFRRPWIEKTQFVDQIQSVEKLSPQTVSISEAIKTLKRETV